MPPMSTADGAPEAPASTVFVDGRPVDGPSFGNPSPGLRASDADRQATVAQLQDAVARGLLTHDEGSERMAAAYDARYLHDLPPLTADLPAPAASRASAPGWRALLTTLWLQLRIMVNGSPTGRPSRRRLAVVGGVVLAVVVLLVLGVRGLNGLVDGPHGHGGLHGR